MAAVPVSSVQRSPGFTSGSAPAPVPTAPPPGAAPLLSAGTAPWRNGGRAGVLCPQRLGGSESLAGSGSALVPPGRCGAGHRPPPRPGTAGVGRGWVVGFAMAGAAKDTPEEVRGWGGERRPAGGLGSPSLSHSAGGRGVGVPSVPSCSGALVFNFYC